MSGQATGWVLRYGPRDRAQRLVLIAIADAANRDGQHSHPGMAAIVEASLYSEGHVSRILTVLAREGWIIVEQHAGPGRAAVYSIPGVLADDSARDARHPDVDIARTSRVLGSTSRVQTRAPTVYTTDLQNPPVVPPRGDEPAFGEFWDAYPRKEAKAAAARAWLKASRRAAPATIIDGALRYRADPNRDPAFTCHASTWLNQDRWSDPPLPARRRSTADVLHEDDPAQQHAVMRLLGLEAAR